MAHSRAPQVCAVTALTSCPTAPHALATFKHAEHSPPQDLCTCLYSHRATQAGTLPVASLAAPLSPSFRPGSGDHVCGCVAGCRHVQPGRQTGGLWGAFWVGCSTPPSSQGKLGPIASINQSSRRGTSAGPSSPGHLGSFWLSHQRANLNLPVTLSRPLGPRPHLPVPPPGAAEPPAAPLPAAAAAQPRGPEAPAAPSAPAAAGPRGRAGTGPASASWWPRTAARGEGTQCGGDCPELPGHYQAQKAASLPLRSPHEGSVCSKTHDF